MRPSRPRGSYVSVASFPARFAPRLHKGAGIRDRAQSKSRRTPQKGAAALVPPTSHAVVFRLLRLLLAHFLFRHLAAVIHLLLGALGGGGLAGRLIGARTSLGEGGGGRDNANGGSHQNRNNAHFGLLEFGG